MRGIFVSYDVGICREAYTLSLRGGKYDSLSVSIRDLIKCKQKIVMAMVSRL